MEEFDIRNHEFEDGDIVDANRAMGQRLFLNFTDGQHVQLCEDDVLALACHYGITQQKIFNYENKINGDK